MHNPLLQTYCLGYEAKQKFTEVFTSTWTEKEVVILKDDYTQWSYMTEA